MTPVLVEVVRGGFVESVHRGDAVICAPDGTVSRRIGDPDRVILPRSAVKPVQIDALLAAGLTVGDDLLAVASASHSGGAVHLDAVRRLLGSAGLDAASLRTPPDLPYGEPERRAWLAAGRAPEPLVMNCSGKHAAMLACCVGNGWPTDGYLDPGHPVQQAIRSHLAETASEQPAVVTVDGCGAPLLGVSLTGLVRAVQRCAGPGTVVGRAMTAHPGLVGGDGREVTRLMSAVPGLLVKDGAEAVWVAVTPDGTGLGVKVADGALRAGGVAIAALCAGVLGGVPDDVADLRQPALWGGGRPVGVLRAAGPLAAA